MDQALPLATLDREYGFGTYGRMRIVLTYGAILAAMCLSRDACAADDERFIPDCAGRVAIAHVRVVRAEPDGALILPDGRVLVLEGVRLPLADKRMADKVLAVLRDMVLGGAMNFTTDMPVKDRYGRIRVQGFGQAWLQTALLEQGLARVQISPDRSECAPALYEAEARARARQAGIWALADYQVRAPGMVGGVTGSFQLVEGLVSNIGHADGRTFIDLGDRQFSVVIGAADRKAFRDFDFDELSGRRVRVRGIMQDYRGRPEIALSNPAQIELLDN